MRMLDFWLLTFAAATTTGMALVFINNASALVESLGGDSSTVVRARPLGVPSRAARRTALSADAHC